MSFWLIRSNQRLCLSKQLLSCSKLWAVRPEAVKETRSFRWKMCRSTGSLFLVSVNQLKRIARRRKYSAYRVQVMGIIFSHRACWTESGKYEKARLNRVLKTLLENLQVNTGILHGFQKDFEKMTVGGNFSVWSWFFRTPYNQVQSWRFRKNSCIVMVSKFLTLVVLVDRYYFGNEVLGGWISSACDS